MPHITEFKRDPDNQDKIKMVLKWVLLPDLKEDGVGYDSDSEIEHSDGGESDEDESDDDETDDDEDESDEDESDDDEPDGDEPDGEPARKPSGELKRDDDADGDNGRRDKQSNDRSKLERDRLDIAKATEEFVTTLQSKGISIEIDDIARLIDERSRQTYGDGVDKTRKQAASSVAVPARADNAKGQSMAALDSADSTQSSATGANREVNTLYDGSHINAAFKMLNSLPQRYNVMNKAGMPSCRRHTKWSPKKTTSSEPRSSLSLQ